MHFKTHTSISSIFTISIGEAGTFTDDSAMDVAAKINAAIATAPTGESIVIEFNPGTYGVASTILLPSNTSVIGDDATLQPVQIAGIPANSGALIANLDSHTADGGTTTNLVNGTSITFQSWNAAGTVCQSESGSVATIIDSNISVEGLTFAMDGDGGFSTWFTNARNIDVQNNVYIGGGDGNAFVNVVNGIVAANLAIGQTNAAFDNWNGPVNISIDDNATYMSAAPNTGWSVLMNSTPSGDPNNFGNASNDGIIGNLFASGATGQTTVDANALTSYGFTTESLITQQGNIDSMNGQVGQTDNYTSDPANDFFIENNITSGLNDAAGVSQNSYAFLVVSSATTGPDDVTGTQILGNLAEGDFSNEQSGIIQNIGNGPTTDNNAIFGAGASWDDIETNGLAGALSQSGNVAPTNGTIPAIPLESPPENPAYDISAPANVFVLPDVKTQIAGIAIDDQNINDTLSVTLLTQFGSLSISPQGLRSSTSVVNGETATTLTGSVKNLDFALSDLNYTSNGAGWDDTVEILLSNGPTLLADRYISVLNISGTETDADLITLTQGQLALMGLDTISNSFPGDAILAPSGNDSVDMGSTCSLVFLGSGQNTVTGGVNAGYITTGEGDAFINLTGGGNYTIAGGPGQLNVNALVGNNLIEPGASSANITTGSGANTILGGLGNLSVTSGTGILQLETLPQDGGDLNATIGIGGGTIYALSGSATLSTTALATDAIYLGLGQDTLSSAANDVVYTGAGSAYINATAGGSDVIYGGTGKLTFIGGAQQAIIDPAAVSTLTDNAGNLTVLSDGNFSLTVNSIANAHRIVFLPGLSEGVTLSGYSNNAIEQITQATTGTIVTISLEDGTKIELPNVIGESIQFQEIGLTSSYKLAFGKTNGLLPYIGAPPLSHEQTSPSASVTSVNQVQHTSLMNLTPFLAGLHHNS